MGDTEEMSTFPRDFIKIKSPCGSEDVHYSLLYEGVPEEFQLYARNELNETEDNKEKGIKQLRALVEKEKLPQCTDDDIIGILRCSKYNTKKAESRLKKFLKFRRKTIEMIKNLDKNKLDYIFDDMTYGPLPYRDKHGRLIVFARLNMHYDLYQVEDLITAACAFSLFAFSFPLTTLCGLSFICDNKTDNLLIYYPLLKWYRTCTRIMLDLPMRYGRADIVNENSLVNWFYPIMRRIIPKKLTEKIHFHGKGYEGLKTIYHPDILPEDFDGNLDPINNKYFKERFLNFMEKLESENDASNTQMTI